MPFLRRNNQAKGLNRFAKIKNKETNVNKQKAETILTHLKKAGLIALAWCGLAGALPAAEPVTVDGLPVHPTRILARYRPGVILAQGANVLNQQALAVLDEFQTVPRLVSFDLADPKGFAAAAARPSAVQQKELLGKIDALRRSGLFDYVEPDYLVHAVALPTDAAFTDETLWGLRNTGQNGGVAGMDVGATNAWNVTTGSSNVIVAVIDTGIRYTHQDLAGQMWINPGEIPANGIDDDGDGYIDNVYGINAITGSGNPLDDNNHGTHVSGTIGARANGGGPHVGVTWGVRLMACKFLSAEGGGSTTDAIKCIDFATLKGAKIMNNSWGGGGFSQALLDSIMGARNAGVLFVAATGNESSNNDSIPAYPAGYAVDNIIAVAAIDRTGALASFSNYGRNTVHLGAPGVSIYSSTATSDSSYDLFNGTSMATPHVVGVAALIRSQYPGISLAELKQRLLVGTVATPSLAATTITGGRVNAYNSLTVAADGILEISINPASDSALLLSSNITVRVSVTDLAPVTNATVIAIGPDGTNYLFLNNGVPPDDLAADHVYSRLIPVPPAATNLALTFITTAPGKISATNSVLYTFVLPPPNDDYINRIPLAGATNSVSGYNTNATKEAGEPLHAGNSGGRSVWWSWTAPSNGVAVVDTIGSSFDTTLGVYTGTNVSSLTTIASDDDGGGSLASRVVFNGTAGTPYRIAVDGFSGRFGAIELHVGIGTAAALTLAEALDATNLVWSTGGSANWFPQTLVIHDGVDAAQSGVITHLQESWMQTTVTGPGALSYWWKVSSESGFDYLEFHLDGALQAGRISGEVNWQQVSLDIGPGTHALRWRYTKDGSVNSGQDAAWVDQVAFMPGGRPDLAINAADRGWYNATGYHLPSNDNYFVGNDGNTNDSPYRNWFVFNIPALSNVVSLAELRVYTATFATPDPGELYELRHVSTPVPTLVAGDSGRTNIWADLADGPIYGSHYFTPDESQQFISIPLNAQCLSNILAAAGGAFALGGQLTTLSPDPASFEYLFAGSGGGNPSETQLILHYLNTNQPPTIQTHPQNVTASPGDNVTLSVTAVGAGPLTYQWRFHDTNLPGATQPTLLITNVQAARTGPYSVAVSNPNGTTQSATAVLSLLEGGLYMGLVITGPVGANYRVDYRTDVLGVWLPLTTLTLPFSPYPFIDPTPVASGPRRFYRAVNVP